MQPTDTCPDCSRPNPGDVVECECGYIFKLESEYDILLGIVQRNPWKCLIAAWLFAFILRGVGAADGGNGLHSGATAMWIMGIVLCITGYALRFLRKR